MALSDGFADFVAEVFEELGPVSVRRMFGGAGIYADDVMFGLADDDVIYLKTDDALKAELGGAGAQPFLFTPKKGPHAGQPQEMGYWSLPDAALDDRDEAAVWARKALAVARAAKAKKPKSGKRKKT